MILKEAEMTQLNTLTNFTYHVLPKPPNTDTTVKRSDASSGGKGKWLSGTEESKKTVFFLSWYL